MARELSILLTVLAPDGVTDEEAVDLLMKIISVGQADAQRTAEIPDMCSDTADLAAVMDIQDPRVLPSEPEE